MLTSKQRFRGETAGRTGWGWFVLAVPSLFLIRLWFKLASNYKLHHSRPPCRFSMLAPQQVGLDYHSSVLGGAERVLSSWKFWTKVIHQLFNSAMALLHRGPGVDIFFPEKISPGSLQNLDSPGFTQLNAGHSLLLKLSSYSEKCKTNQGKCLEADPNVIRLQNHPKVMNTPSKMTSKCNVNIVPDCRDPVLLSICFFENARRSSSTPILFLNTGLHISEIVLFLT